MAYADYSVNIPKIHAVRAVVQWYRMGTWPQLFPNVTSDLMGAGDAVRRPRISRNPTLRDWSDNGTIPAATTTVTDYVQLNVDQRKSFNHYFGLDEMTALRFNTRDRVIANNANALDLEFSDHIRSRFITAVTTSANASVALAAASNVAQTSVTAANFGNAAHIKAIFDSFDSMKILADRRFWPREGRFVVVSPEYGNFIKQQLISLNIHFITNNNDRLISTADPLSPLAGWSVIVDVGIPAAKTAGANRHPMYWGVRGYGMEYVFQFLKSRTIEDRDLVGTEAQTFIKYGAVRNQDDHVVYSPLTIT